ncbi:MAG: hypothetical protein K6T83_00960 [Alicyclobacillus sp.]|nr:hypothetical protein [Alicyclobacillus sp.]
MNAAIGRESSSHGIGKRLMWVLLVVLAPIVAAAVMVAIALQLVGFPVWHDVMHLVSPATSSKQDSALMRERQQVTAERTKIFALQRETRVLKSRLAAEQSTNKHLESKVQQLEKVVMDHVNAQEQAKREASVLVSMDAGQAAQLLAKLPVEEAAHAVAAMNSSDSGPILGQMDPALSSQILSRAAQLSSGK